MFLVEELFSLRRTIFIPVDLTLKVPNLILNVAKLNFKTELGGIQSSPKVFENKE